MSESSQVAVIYTHAIDFYRSVKWVFMMDEEGKRSKLLLVGYRGRPGMGKRERGMGESGARTLSYNSCPAQ